MVRPVAMWCLWKNKLQGFAMEDDGALGAVSLQEFLSGILAKK